MPAFTITLPSGRSWTPRFATSINRDKCIGCGRCFKVCGRGVLQLMALDDEGQFIAIDDGDDDEYEKKVMTIAHAQNCVGCEACARTCAKKCISHAPSEA